MNATIIQQFGASVPPRRSPAPATDQKPVLTLARIPVLVIEDEAMIAWMLESLLEDLGFEVIALASDAAEAVAAAARRAPELVISDINLGAGPDGIEAVAIICGTCSPAVVFVSGFIDEHARKRISEQVAGARILSKPLSSDGLSAVMSDALGLKSTH